MDIETQNYTPFTPLSHQDSSSTLPNIFSSPCSTTPHHPSGHCLKLVNNTLILCHPSEATHHLPLTFQIKFQPIRQVEKDVTSAKTGIRLYNQEKASLKLYLERTAADAWSRILEKRVNQSGFHDMFKPIRKLGKGNFATVYEAERVTDKVRFAVKAFSKQNSYSAKNGKESLINELAVLRQLNTEPHPNVLKLEAVFQSDNSIYVVLELLPGQTLFQTIQERKGHFTKAEVKAITGGLLSGLRHIHNQRVMHRDLKPQNIMLRGDTLQPVIVDFGLASNVDLKEYLFFRCGTPGYVAPEIIRLAQSQHIEPACDIFSLGAIFHVLLVRKALFEGTKYDQVYRNNKEFKFTLQGEQYQQVEPSAIHLLSQMLILDPNTRIKPEEALSHPYFVGEMEAPTELKISSPVLTQSGSTIKTEKRKKLFLFF